MHFLSRNLLFFLVISSSHLVAQVHVIMTSAILNLDYERRKQEYIRSINSIKSYGIEPWIIEATNIDHSFFDEISTQVLYPQVNNLSIGNKGVNETMSIKTSIPYLPFDDEDIVIKLTGRYWLYSREFIDIIESTCKDYDAYVCFGKHFVGKKHIFTGCFALRWKHYKKIIDEMDFERAEKDWLPIEMLFADAIQNHHLRIKVVDPLHVNARIFFDGQMGLDNILEF